MKFCAIVVAAGMGTRFGGPKQFVELAGRPLLEHTVEPFIESVDQVVLVLPADVLGEVDTFLSASVLEELLVVAGGNDRSESVKNGLASIESDIAGVLVHDGARPLVSLELIERVKSSIVEGAQVVVPVTDLSETLYKDSGQALDRSNYRLAQTPQGFTVEALIKAHSNSNSATDDGTLAIAAGYKATLVEGDGVNKKVTFPSDIAVVEHYLSGGES